MKTINIINPGPSLTPKLIAIALAFFAALSMAKADPVELTVSPAVRASAEYAPGDSDKPAVVLVHGFMQTRDSPIIYRLVDHLKSLHYTVLAPTISLGIDLREQSLDCDAVHPHTLDDEVREIGLWVDWLTERTDTPIVLVGHSTGALSVLTYLNMDPSPQIIQGVLLSLVHMGIDSAGRQQIGDVLKARVKAENGESDGIDIYRLAYCDKYPAPADAYMSYIRWDSSTVLNAIKNTKRPLVAVFGTADRTAPSPWRGEVAEVLPTVKLIDGGDHFFREMAEFELADTLNGILASPPAHPAEGKP